MKRCIYTITLLLLCTTLWAQIDVQGTIKDDKGEPVIGASIVIQGTTEGTVTDIDGNFQLRANKGAKLNISYVGYKTQTITVSDNKPLVISMEEDSELLEDVVVIGYGTVRKSDMTGAIASVKTEEMNMSVANLEQALIGHTPGVEIKQTSGAPGAGTTIHIRGVNSVYGGVEPLYVVDGFPASKDVFINPNDVESIEVLKDAASAAIYGSRAGGGVILITTKRGAEGKPRVQVDYQFSMQQVQHKIDMMSAADFKQLHMDGYNNAYFDFLRKKYPTTDDAVLWARSRNDDKAKRTAEGAGNTMYLCPDIVDSDYDTDWQDEIFRNAPMHKVNFSVSGGKDKFKYMFSAGYLNQDGIVAPSNHQRITTRLNMDIDVTKRFTIGVNTNMYYVKERVVRTDGLAFNDGVILNALGMPPTYPAYNEDGSYALGWSYRNGESTYMCFGGENPVAIANGREEYNTKMRASINANLKYKLYEGLYAKVNMGVQIADQIYNLYRPSWLGQSNYAPGNYTTNSLVTAKDERDFNTDWLLEATISYDQTFKKKHTVSALVGYSMQKKIYNNIDANSVLGALPDDRITELSAAKATETDENGTKAKTDKIAWSLMSFFGRAMYNYDHRYTVSLTLRGDGCSRFGAKNRWGLFPSVSAGWNITNEHWAEHIQDIFTAKLRGSWGISGNNNISNYRHIATIKTGSYVFGKAGTLVTTYYPSSVDDKLGWEKTSQFNVGADITFWSGRLSLVMNYYYSVTTDLLYQNTTSATTGVTSMWTNLKDGRVINQGGDLQIDANVLNMAGVKWNIGFNISLNRNVVYGLQDDIIIKGQRQQITHITRNGYPIGSYYGMVSEGLITPEDYALIKQDRDNLTTPGYTRQGPVVANYDDVYIGDVKWKDVNGDGKITEDDRDIIGDNYPDFSYGFNTTISWKGLSLSASFDGQYGNQVINFSRYYICNNEGGVNTMTTALNRYRGEYYLPYEINDDMMFRANRSQKNLNTKFSTFFVEDASFLRMTNITLGYTIPDNKVFRAIHLSKMHIYFSVDNVFTATKYTGYNPDVDYNDSNTAPGLDFGTYPLARSYSGGIKLTF